VSSIASGLWHLVTNSSCITPPYHSATHAFYYGQDSTCNYKVGNGPTSYRTAGTLTSPAVSINPGTSVTLSFWYWRQVEYYASGSYDKTYAEVSYDGGATWQQVWSRDSSTTSDSVWAQFTTTLSPPAGASNIRVRFTFDSVDGSSNTYTGWFIDDVVVTQ
jgi:hypothetical protein